jgi:Na+/H+ antiporter NhaD/arsenite permease-like protein
MLNFLILGTIKAKVCDTAPFLYHNLIKVGDDRMKKEMEKNEEVKAFKPILFISLLAVFVALLLISYFIMEMDFLRIGIKERPHLLFS